MKKEDYFKYYIQGSDHYLIPKDIFDELFQEMANWKEESKQLQRKINNAIEKVEILRKAYERNISSIPCTEIEEIDRKLKEENNNE